MITEGRRVQQEEDGACCRKSIWAVTSSLLTHGLYFSFPPYPLVQP